MEKVKFIAAILILWISLSFSQSIQTKLFRYIEENSLEKLKTLLNENSIDLNKVRNQDGLYPLHYAALLGKYRIVPLLIEHGANVNLEVVGDGFAASLATRKGNIECVKDILEADFDPDKKTTRRGWTLLHWAAAYGQFGIAKMLINDYDATVNSYSKKHQLPFEIAEQAGYEKLGEYLKLKGWMEAAWNGDINLLKKYLKIGIDIDVRDPELYNRTAIFMAAWNGQVGAIEFLVKKGASLNIKDERGENALWLACVDGDLETIKTLIQFGVQWQRSVPSYGYPVSQAVSKGYLSVVKYFIEELGFDVNSRDQEGWTLLHWAAKYNETTDIVKYLLHKGADREIKNDSDKIPYDLAKNSAVKELLNPKAPIPPIAEKRKEKKKKQSDLNEELLQAAESGRGDLILPLIDQGADINVQDSEGRTPLHLAVDGGYFKTTRTLINLGADVNRPDAEGLTPIFYATFQGNLKIVRLLVDHGAIWDKAIPRYGFPVSQAASQGYLDIVAYFIEELNFDINAQDKEGYTLLHTVARFPQPQVAQYLLDHGIDIWILDQDGKTALDIAKEYGSQEMVNLLEKLYDKKALVNLFISAIFREDTSAIVEAYQKQPDFRDGQGNTAIHYCVQMNKPDILKFIIRKYHPDLDILNNQNTTPLLLALKKDNKELVKILIEEGASYSVPSDSLFFKTLIESNDKDLLRYFLLISKLPIPIDKQDETGRTLLHWAVIQQSEGLVNYLLQNHAKVNIQDHRGWTPLFYALQIKNSALCKTLLKYHAQLDIADKKGLTPRQLAEELGVECLPLTLTLKEKILRFYRTVRSLLPNLYNRYVLILLVIIITVFLTILLWNKWRKRFDNLNRLVSYQLISSAGSGNVPNYNNEDDFKNLNSIQEAMDIIKLLPDLKPKIEFQEEFILSRGKRTLRKTLKIHFVIKDPNKIIPEIQKEGK